MKLSLLRLSLCCFRFLAFLDLPCFRPIHDRHSSLPVSVTPPHPSILEPLLFPDLHSILDSLETLLPRPPSCGPMRSRHCNQNALFSNIHSPQAMGNRDARQRVCSIYRSSDALEGAKSERNIGGVREMRDDFGLEVIPSAAYIFIML